MADGFYVVPVRIEDKGAIIVRVIMPADARCAVVAPAGGQRCGMESAHGFATRRLEGQVNRPRRCAGAEPELGPALGAEQGPALALADNAHAERRQNREIE